MPRLGRAQSARAPAPLGTGPLTPRPTLPAVARAQAADEARGLAIDSIAKAASGHMGLPLGCADLGAVLFGQELSYNPDKPDWINRDRFILSAGHGSMFLYSWLHLAGYDLPMEEVKNFRVKDSKTPGHPEFGWTPGVESTTGPLGQGVGNGVGMAAAAKLAGATLNTPEHSIIDHHVVVLKDDGVRTFRGVYAVGRGGACEKIHGRGPARFAEADVATFLKFNSARRAFVKLPSRSFSLTTDAVMLSASVLPKNKPVLY